MTMDTSNWTYEDYIAFLMVYAAFADFRIDQKEQDYIKKRVGKEEFDRMLNYFKELNDVEQINIILDFKKQFCKTEEDREKILSDFVDVLKEDHEIDAREEAVYIGVRRLLMDINKE